MASRLATLVVLSFLAVLCRAQVEDDLPRIPSIETPKLTGQHFRITAPSETDFVDVRTINGKRVYSGYLVDILDEISLRAEFTYELRPPSGFGSLCSPRLVLDGNSSSITDHPDAYNESYWFSYKCGESDVNDRPISAYSTDMYLGMYYITLDRLKANKFSIPFSPPGQSTLGMMGTATHILDIPSLANHNPFNYTVCGFSGTAYLTTLAESFPALKPKGIPFSSDMFQVFQDGTCDVVIDAYPFLKKHVKRLADQGQCRPNGKPVGLIGEPLPYGFNHFAIGVRSDLPDDVLFALNYWLQALMACFPQDPNGYCFGGEGSLSVLYSRHDGGAGDECGYVQFPPEEVEKLHPASIVAIALAPVLVVIGIGLLWHLKQLKEQEQRMKKRFIQQLARNIDIGPSAREISADKLAQAFHHIGGKKDMISKQDLAQWMNDLHLDFLSEHDFERLWDTMDTDNNGFIDPLDFCHFLGECDKQFQEVYEEYKSLPKTERMKLATRRLTNIYAHGEEEVQKMERRNNRRQRLNANLGSGAPLADAEVLSATEPSKSSLRKLWSRAFSKPAV